MATCIVGVSFNKEKFTMLEDALKTANFRGVLESRFSESGKPKDSFSIVIKPNLMMFTHSEDPPATYTDPQLVEHLVKILQDVGYKNIKLVEAQNIYGNWYDNRTVANVSAAAGFSPGNLGYQFCDLTEEAEGHDYGGKLQKHLVGKSWRDADFRISFAKNKTHVSNLYTLTLKNVYGTLPAQDKALEYHAKREWDESTLDNLKNFLVHFGIIDAVYSADGLLGFKGTAFPKHTKMILASCNLIAVDIVAGRMMGVRPKRSKLTALAIKQWGMPEITLKGIEEDYRHPGWDNVSIKGRISRCLFNLVTRIWGRRPEVPAMLGKSYLYHLLQEKMPEFMQKATDLLEESYLGFNLGGIISNGLVGDKIDTELFPRKKHLSESLIVKAKENLKDIIYNKKRRRAIFRDLFANLFGESDQS